mgnify:FL=1|jgi:hypothetical protein|tara:strand:+ start:207 stop:419 length:213 start_codon:yes stop_codon:yes gene_type:complete
MKMILAMIVCSALYEQCTPPITLPSHYNSWYACMNAGYQEAKKMNQSFGYKKVNDEQLFVKFYCKEANTI